MASLPNSPVEEPRRPAHPYDEIDLVAVGASLFRRWKLILVITVTCMVIGVVAALLRTPRYAYRASIQLGGRPFDNRTQLLSLESTAKALLENAFLDTATAQYARTHKGSDAWGIRIKVNAPRGGGVVILVGNGPAKLQGAYETVERSAAKLLRDALSSQTAGARAEFEARYESADLGLKSLEDPMQVKARKVALRQVLINAQTRLENLKHQHKVLKNELSVLTESRVLYERLDKKLNAYLAQARANSLNVSHTSTPMEAMTAMLLSNQTQRTYRQLVDTEKHLTVDLPQQITRIEAALANNEQSQAAQTNAVEKAQIEYGSFDEQQLRAVALKKVAVGKFRSRLDNLRETKLIGQPTRSRYPVGQSRKRIVAIAGIFGFVLALLSAALVNYFIAVRQELRVQGGQSSRQV